MKKNDLIINRIIIPEDLVKDIDNNLNIPSNKIKTSLIDIIRDYIFIRRTQFPRNNPLVNIPTKESEKKYKRISKNQLNILLKYISE